MSETKYRIPKLALAVMVLGANGCGDDDGGSGGSKTPSTGRDGGATTSNGRDGGVATNTGRDSGTSTVRDAGVATGRDSGTATTPGAFDSRYATLATGLCKLVFSCEPGSRFAADDGDVVSFTTEKECVAMFQKDVKEEFAQAGDACVKAFLDYYDCYLGAGCDGELAGCEALYQTYYEACEDF